jgi:hypothetical protein
MQFEILIHSKIRFTKQKKDQNENLNKKNALVALKPKNLRQYWFEATTSIIMKQIQDEWKKK